MIPILDNSERARRVVLFFWVLLGVFAVSTWGLFALRSVLMNSKVESSDRFQFFAYSLINSSSTLVFLVDICVIVTFLQWFRRAYHNLEKSGYRNEYSNGWAVGVWFIPLANLAWPYRIAKEIWYKTQKEYTAEIRSHSLVRIWWMLYLVSTVGLRIITENGFTIKFGFGSSSWDTPTDLLSTWGFIWFAVKTASIVVSILFVKTVASFESSFYVHTKAETIGQTASLTEDDDREEQY